MITCTFAGGLGNNIFQLVNLLHLAKENRVKYVIPETSARPGIEKFNQETDLEFKKLFDNDFCYGSVDMSQYHQYTHTDMNGSGIFHYQPIPFKDQTCYNGYFQSDRYFPTFDKYDLVLSNEITEQALEKYKHLFNKPTVALHVRLAGDRVQASMQHFHKNVSLEFYEASLNIICDNINRFNVLVFSDDMPRAKELFRDRSFHFIENNHNTLDFILMTMCDYNIVGNSTFSWWAAYLNKNNKLTIAPKTDWFGPGYSHFNLNDLFPKYWITL